MSETYKVTEENNKIWVTAVIDKGAQNASIDEWLSDVSIISKKYHYGVELIDSQMFSLKKFNCQ